MASETFEISFVRSELPPIFLAARVTPTSCFVEPIRPPIGCAPGFGGSGRSASDHIRSGDQERSSIVGRAILPAAAFRRLFSEPLDRPPGSYIMPECQIARGAGEEG